MITKASEQKKLKCNVCAIFNNNSVTTIFVPSTMFATIKLVLGNFYFVKLYQYTAHTHTHTHSKHSLFRRKTIIWKLKTK